MKKDFPHEFWSSAGEAENWELLGFLASLRKKGIDPLRALKNLFPDVKGGEL
jgi:hypothetical protein